MKSRFERVFITAYGLFGMMCFLFLFRIFQLIDEVCNYFTFGVPMVLLGLKSDLRQNEDSSDKFKFVTPTMVIILFSSETTALSHSVYFPFCLLML